MKIEISDPTRGETENWRANERCATLSLGLALGLGLAHFLELCAFREDFRPPLV